MSRRLAVALLVGGAATVWPAEALAVSNTASDDGVTPQLVAGNPADCASAGVSGATTLFYNSNKSGTASDGNGATVGVTTSDSITFSFSATLPSGQMILGVLAKGGSQGGNLYDYRTLSAGGALSDGNLHPPPTGNGGQFAGISHILFCYGTPVPQSNGGGGGTTTPPGGGGTTTPPGSAPSTTTTTSATSAVKGVTTKNRKKQKKHKKRKKHHVKAKAISRPPRVSSGFTG